MEVEEPVGVEVCLLGPVEVHGASGVGELTAKSVELIAYLACHPEGVPDDRSHVTRQDIAAGFQAAVVDVLADRASHALHMMPVATALVVAGGVAANGPVRTALAAVAANHGLPLLAPPIRLCTDNAVMVAWAGQERLRLGLVDSLDHAPRPRWPLEELAA